MHPTRRSLRATGILVALFTLVAFVSTACQLVIVSNGTTTSLSVSSGWDTVGESVTLTASVTSTTPGLSVPAGPVTFTDGNTILATVTSSGPTATFTTTSLALGTHHLAATYTAPSGWSSSASAPIPVTVANPGSPYYLSLGDSLATGTGAPAGEGYVDDIYNYESTRVPGLLEEKLGCGGATTTSMIDGGGCSYPEGTQLATAEAFLQAHLGQVAFVTIDIGANDITSCFSSSGINATCAQTQLGVIETNLAQILSGLRSAGGAVPIFGMTYYDPFLAYWVAGDQSAAQQSETLAVTGNAASTNVYTAAGAFTADVQGAFDTTDFSLTGSYLGVTVPQNVSNICAWTLMCQSQNIHANATGHQVIASAFEPLIDANVG